MVDVEQQPTSPVTSSHDSDTTTSPVKIVDMTPERITENEQAKEHSYGSVTDLPKKSRGKARSSKSGRRSNTTDTTEAETETLGHSQGTMTTAASGSLEASSGLLVTKLGLSSQTMQDSNSSNLFYKTDSQRKLQEQLKHASKVTGTPQPSQSYLSNVLRLEEEEVEEGLQQTRIRQGIENARRNLSSMRKWKTPYDIDPPQRIRLPSERSLDTTASSSTTFSSSAESDPLVVERQIWTGIERLMADAFSECGSVCTEDVLPKNLMRAMSSRSIATSTGQSQLSPEELGEIQMAQVTLNSFMDMLLPDESKQQEKLQDSIPSLETVSEHQIAKAEVALHNFMDVLLHDLEEDLQQQKSDTSNNNSSKVQILDLFQWSLKVNIDAQEKIRYMEQERLRLEEERQRELEELMETERRLEQERARRQREEEIRRRRIRQLEESLKQEQQALANANRKSRRKKRYPRSIPEEGDDDVWAKTPGGKPAVIKNDEGSIDPATLAHVRNNKAGDFQQENQRSSGEMSTESERVMQYIVTSNEPSPNKVPEFGQEGTLPREPQVMRMPSWTMINGAPVMMATSHSIETLSQDSSISNHLPSSFHEGPLSDSDSSRTGVLRRHSSRVARSTSNGSSLDMPDLTSIHEDSVLDSIETPPFIAKGDAVVNRSYPGGVPKIPTPDKEPSIRQKFSRVPSSGRLGIVSATGDVFTDDVSRYSFSKFFADSNRTSSESKPRTDIISVGSAGDIHQLVGSTVRVHEGSSSSEDDYSSESSSDDITLDSDLHRDEQIDARSPVPPVNNKWETNRSFGGRIKSSFKAMRKRGKCVTNTWFCDRPGVSVTKRKGQMKRLTSRQCLLHGEDSPYDRTHVLEESRLKIDDNGFVVGA